MSGAIKAKQNKCPRWFAGRKAVISLRLVTQRFPICSCPAWQWIKVLLLLIWRVVQTGVRPCRALAQRYRRLPNSSDLRSYTGQMDDSLEEASAPQVKIIFQGHRTGLRKRTWILSDQAPASRLLYSSVNVYLCIQ